MLTKILVLTGLMLLAVVTTTPDPAAIKIQGSDTIGNIVLTAAVAPGAPGSLQTALTSSASAGNASNVATLSAAVGKTTFITGFTATAAGATGASNVTITVVGTFGGTLNYTFTFPAGATTAATPIGAMFNPAIPASATNTAIVVTFPAGGAGNLNASITAYGFQQ
jgi:hypothetical protein